MPVRQKRDAALCREIERVFQENFGVYGVRKVWRQMLREGIEVAALDGCLAERKLGLRKASSGARR